MKTAARELPRSRSMSAWRSYCVLLVHPIARTGPAVIDRLLPIGDISTGICGLALNPGRKGLRGILNESRNDSLTIETVYGLFSPRRSGPPAPSFITR